MKGHVYSAFAVSVVAALAFGFAAPARAAVVLPTVPVGNAGNAGELQSGVLYGAVAYQYRIGTFEVSAGQYAEFLNAVARTDTYSLYNPTMASNTAGCRILRSGASGSFVYSVTSGYENRPANYISWGDAARFANWMHNGQPVGPQGLATTEDGSYFLNGVADSALNTISRESDATWAIPTEDEWYKAAYHRNDGVTANYWDYATRSDTQPGKLLNDISGNNANYGPNPANPIDGTFWTTLVGEFENSFGPYGTFDQNGNVREWTEARVGTGNTRVLRGGDWLSNAAAMQSATRSNTAAGGTSQNNIGLRLAFIPAPSTLAIHALALAAFGRRRRSERTVVRAASV